MLNGSNCDHDSKKIYENWLIQNKNSDTLSGSKTADMKSAIINEFKNNASILISTESGSEGVNMQFCSILINYDLPWNPTKMRYPGIRYVFDVSKGMGRSINAYR